MFEWHRETQAMFKCYKFLSKKVFRILKRKKREKEIRVRFKDDVFLYYSRNDNIVELLKEFLNPGRRNIACMTRDKDD